MSTNTNISILSSDDFLYDAEYSRCFENKDKNDKYEKYFFDHPSFEKIAEKLFAIDNYLDKPFESVDGSETCVKCGSMKTIAYNKQTRSSDEGMTVFVFCIQCKHRAVFNS
jgi:DNA-directed RNA polymerase subunit M/transcription elongation factor TFIIS